MDREINDFNEIPEMFPWEPTFNKVIITLNKVKPDNNLVLSDNTMSEEQYVVAVGPSAKQYFNVNDRVLIDLDKMLVTEINPNDTHEKIQRVKIEPIEYNDVMYAIIDDRLIKAKYKG